MNFTDTLVPACPFARLSAAVGRVSYRYPKNEAIRNMGPKLNGRQGRIVTSRLAETQSCRVNLVGRIDQQNRLARLKCTGFDPNLTESEDRNSRVIFWGDEMRRYIRDSSPDRGLPSVRCSRGLRERLHPDIHESLSVVPVD